MKKIKLVFVISSIAFLSALKSEAANKFSRLSKPRKTDSTLDGQKKLYSRSPYTTADNLVLNSDFSSGLASYQPMFLTDSNGKNLYSIVKHNNKNWLRLDDGSKSTTSDQGYVGYTINIPEGKRKSLFEISFLVSGYYTTTKINNVDFNPTNVQIDSNKAERLYYYFNPNGAQTITLKLCRAYPNTLIPGTHVDYSEILVKEATYKVVPIANLPRTGSSIQLARWVGRNWDEEKQEKILANYRKIGGLNRVWLSADLFANYTIKPAHQRTSVSSRYFSAKYKTITNENIPYGLDPAKVHYLDWFFTKCKQYGFKLHICLGGGFHDGKGNPDSLLSTPATYEFIDSDPDMRDGFIKLFTSIVNRYKSYDNIIGWEFVNEGFSTWSNNYAGLNPNIPNYLKSTLFPGYRSFEREAYKAIKAIDQTRPVILNSGTLTEGGGSVLDADDVCDWVCPSLYPGAISINPNSIRNGNTFVPTRGYGQILSTITNGASLILNAAPSSVLPEGLINGQRYFVTNLNTTSFQLAATQGGSPINVTVAKGGKPFFLYADDATGVEFADYLIKQISYDPKFVYFSEFGAQVLGNLRLYQNEDVNEKYIKAFAKKMRNYGVASLLTYDEGNLMFNNNSLNFSKPGKALISIRENIANK